MKLELLSFCGDDTTGWKDTASKGQWCWRAGGQFPQVNKIIGWFESQISMNETPKLHNTAHETVHTQRPQPAVYTHFISISSLFQTWAAGLHGYQPLQKHKKKELWLLLIFVSVWINGTVAASSSAIQSVHISRMFIYDSGSDNGNRNDFRFLSACFPSVPWNRKDGWKTFLHSQLLPWRSDSNCGTKANCSFTLLSRKKPPDLHHVTRRLWSWRLHWARDLRTSAFELSAQNMKLVFLHLLLTHKIRQVEVVPASSTDSCLDWWRGIWDSCMSKNLRGADGAASTCKHRHSNRTTCWQRVSVNLWVSPAPQAGHGFHVQSNVSTFPQRIIRHTRDPTALQPPGEEDVHILALRAFIHMLGDRTRPLNDVCVPEVTGSSFICYHIRWPRSPGKTSVNKDAMWQPGRAYFWLHIAQRTWLILN